MHRISRNTNESSNLLQFLLDEVKALARKTRSAEPTPYLPYNLLRDHKGFPNSNTFPSAPKPVTGRHKLVSFHRAVYLLSNIQRHAVNLRNCILNTGPVTQYLPPSLLAHEFNRKQCRKSKASMQFQTMPFLSGERDLKAPGTPANRNSQHLFWRGKKTHNNKTQPSATQAKDKNSWVGAHQKGPRWVPVSILHPFFWCA